MKRILTSALALLLLAGTVQAQQTEKKDMDQKHEAAIKHLNLTPDQQAKMKAIHAEQKAEADALKNARLTVDEHKARRKELHEKYQARMKAILTPEQQEKMETMHNNRAKNKNRGEMKHGKEGMKHGKSGMKHGKEGMKHRKEGMKHEEAKKGEQRDTIRAHGNYNHGKDMKARKGEQGKGLADELDLTAEQRSKVKNINKEYKDKLEAVKSDNTLTEEQKRARAREIMKAQQEDVKSVLTPEQVEKMSALRKQRGAKK